MRRKITRPSPSMVVALVALFVALSGTAVAAKLVTGKDIKNRSITGVDIKDGSITSRSVSSALRQGRLGPTGPSGPPGAPGAPGAKGDRGERAITTVYTREFSFPAGTAGEVRCDEDVPGVPDTAVGGSVEASAGSVVRSRPTGAAGGGRPTGWFGQVSLPGIVVHVVCARL